MTRKSKNPIRRGPSGERIAPKEPFYVPGFLAFLHSPAAWVGVLSSANVYIGKMDGVAGEHDFSV
jgi:hypothetical protein